MLYSFNILNGFKRFNIVRVSYAFLFSLKLSIPTEFVGIISFNSLFVNSFSKKLHIILIVI